MIQWQPVKKHMVFPIDPFVAVRRRSVVDGPAKVLVMKNYGKTIETVPPGLQYFHHEFLEDFSHWAEINLPYE